MNPALWMLLAALFVSLVLSAFFAAAEAAFSTVNKVRLKAMSQAGHEKAAKALELAEDSDRLQVSILIGNNIANVAAVVLGTIIIDSWLGTGGPFVAAVIMVVVILTIGEVLPKTLGTAAPEHVTIAMYKPIRIIMALFRPAVSLLVLPRRMVNKRMKASVADDLEEEIIESELITMVDEAQSEGEMDAHESELIRSAIEFNDRDVLSILTPRVDVTALEDTATMEAAAEVFRNSGYSRLPVYHEDMDHVVGVLHEKDFYAAQHNGCTSITEIMKPPVWAPDTLQISKLLKLIQNTKTHMIIVLDEFGGTMGIVTMEDVLEELVGEIYDEHDEIDQEVVVQDDGALLVEGGMQLSELMEHFSIENTYEADTAGGWAAEVLGRIPTIGATFTASGLHVTIMQMDKRRVTQLKVETIAGEKEIPAEV